MVDRPPPDTPPRVAGLKDYIEPGQIDALVQNEQDILKAALGKLYSGSWTGIALSGGGVRSATFCLGALQAMALKGVLPRFDYMSTVSGGGYIGLSLQWFRRKLSQNTTGEGPAPNTNANDFPFGTVHPDPAMKMGNATADQKRALQFLRDNISYLAPGGGITLQSGILAVIRTVFLNLIVWVPLVSLVFLAMLAASYLVTGYWCSLRSPLPNIAVWTQAAYAMKPPPAITGLPSVFALLLWGVLIYIGLMALVAFATSFVARESRAEIASVYGGKRLLQYLAFSLPLPIGLWFLFIEGTSTAFDKVIGAFAIGVGAVALVLMTALLLKGLIAPSAQLSYFLRRGFETGFAKYSNKIIVAAIIGVLPLAHEFLQGEVMASNYGLAGLIFGVGTALYGHYSSLKSLAPGIAGKIFIIGGSFIFLLSFLLICYAIAFLAMHTMQEAYAQMITSPPPATGNLQDEMQKQLMQAATYAGVLIAVVLVPMFSIFFPSINQIGLHRYYRDRLMETFMPGLDGLKNGSSIRSTEADRFEVVQLYDQLAKPASTLRPFPIINTNIILVKDKSRKTHVRGGSSFAITPFHSGSNETGWVNTDFYAKGQGPIQLASAMAVSGAAANSNAGYTGVGITRNRLVSMVMLLLNIRLGLWLTNPRTLNADYQAAAASTWGMKGKVLRRRPRHWHPGLTYGLFDMGYDRDSDFVELSDGGHFENLGIYELARRKASVIVVCDGEADKELSYAGLISAARRIQEDFDAVIDFKEGAGPERLVPNVELGYPSKTQAAHAPYLVAQIRYLDSKTGATVKTGVIIYIKATMIADLSFVSKGYRGKNPDFPHQSTIDQFFQAEQFEAYRELGYRSALRCIDELGLETDFASPDKIWKQYLKLVKQSA